jgi:hypothetical protein
MEQESPISPRLEVSAPFVGGLTKSRLRHILSHVIASGHAGRFTGAAEHTLYLC